jgi:hypothetical protein
MRNRDTGCVTPTLVFRPVTWAPPFFYFQIERSPELIWPNQRSVVRYWHEGNNER